MFRPYLIRLDAFLRNHWIGIFLVAIVTGVLGNFAYDRVKPKDSAPPAPSEIAVAFASSIDRKLVGTWKGITTTKSPTGELIATGFTQLLETGQYNYTGEVELRAPNGTSMLYSAVAAGSWKAVGDRLVLIVSDVKSVPRVLKQPGKPDINLTNPLRTPPHLLPHIEDTMPAGASQEYVITNLTQTRFRAKSSDLRGVPVLYEAVRQ